LERSSPENRLGSHRMRLNAKTKMVGVLSIASLVIAATTYFVYLLNRCPENRLAALEQYSANRPVLPGKFIVNDNQKAIATALVPLWLTWFTSRYADAGIKLKEYDVIEIIVGQWKDDRFLAMATVSVRPTKCSYEEWLTGGGELAENWVRNKSLSFTIVKDGDGFKVDRVGSGP
jgi:hypothetical protein